jgi:DNA-binding transcriptional regulator YdaS (Cro superfamily)
MGCYRDKPVVTSKTMSDFTLERALNAEPFLGNQTKFASAIGTSQQNISNWLKARKRLPGEFVLRAEEVTGISRHVWRPDLYPLADAARPCTASEGACPAN